MDTNSAPDSWEQSDNPENIDTGASEDMSDALQRLNVFATEFVPGRNIHAPVFVPSTTQDENSQPSRADAMETDNQKDSNGPEKLEEEAPDDWLASAPADEVGSESSGAEAPPGGGGDPAEEEQKQAEPMVDESSESEEDAEAPVVKPAPQRKTSDSRKKKEHLNIVFIGHVDAGKSTIGGHIMYLTGQVDKRTLEKYEKEAKEKNRESWYLSWALDTNIEERDKGKTVEVGRAYFETASKFFTILDAPGHRCFVPNMIGGASQADVAVLVISARRGEFETGFERGGQTREHAMLVKTAGVQKLVVVVNKMDDPTVLWEEARYKEIQEKLTPYLKKCGFNPKADIYYLPVSGQLGINLKTCDRSICPWYSGPSLIEYLDSLPPVKREAKGPVRLAIVDRFRDMGTIIMGKLESGSIRKGMTLTLMPNRKETEVMTLWCDDEDSGEPTDDSQAMPGENIKIKLKNIEEEDVTPGFVLCSPNNLCHIGHVFDAQVVILEHKSIICAGYSAVMHIHTAAEEVSIKALLCKIDKKTNEKSKTRPRFIKQDEVAIVRLECQQGVICLEAFKDFPQMGRFTLRDEGRTIAIGKVLKVIS